MKINRSLRWVRPARSAAVVILVAIAAVAVWHLARPFRNGGSSVTNPDAFMSADVAAGLRAASR